MPRYLLAEEVGRLIVSRGKPMPGVMAVLDLLRAAKFELAVASSSPLQLVRTALETFGLIDYFSGQGQIDRVQPGRLVLVEPLPVR